MGHKMNFKSFFYKLRHVGKVFSISLRENNTAYIRSASLQQTVRNGMVVIITWKKNYTQLKEVHRENDNCEFSFLSRKLIFE